MHRRKFLRLGMGGLVIPIMGRTVSGFTVFGNDDGADRKALADAALDAARSKGASYADCRIGRYLNQFVFTREDKVQNIVNTESFGAGVRVLADGTWGFAATSDVGKESLARAAEQAVATARANAKLQKEPVRLAPAKSHGEVSWRTPIEKNAFEVPVSEKVELLLEVNQAALEAGADFVNSVLFLVNEQKYFASTEGSYVDQDVHRIWPNFNVTARNRETGKFQNRQALSAPMGLGYEYLARNPEKKVEGVATVYFDRYDMVQDAREAATQARAMLDAKSVEAGKYDLVLDPTHLWLTIHESVGHPLELDRVLGYEAN